ncbi:anti-virulence regulator CigR family protein [Halomonas organivorans]|uniref:Ni/Co efflux regulator RcnB n=1 Tax=Halomonas organivorans TaxID=257772 RepID=A0A7W5G5Q5_9GAMM|nr:anti-virulence regulator CigR family protein [Halomonas organivorans]MBB3140661.1 Ni/Co efflux regulator RcnB [Halomonas organivorans]
MGSFHYRRLASAGALILGLVALPALANPGNGGPPEHAKGGQGGHGQSERLRQDANGHDARERTERRDERHEARHQERRYDDQGRDGAGSRHHDDLDLEEALIRDIFHRHRDDYAHEEHDAIPPGIRQNLARGKPMPPGIGKRLDDGIRRDLPHYDGYEWRRVGADAVLVEITNDIIHSVIHDVLY